MHSTIEVLPSAPHTTFRFITHSVFKLGFAPLASWRGEILGLGKQSRIWWEDTRAVVSLTRHLGSNLMYTKMREKFARSFCYFCLGFVSILASFTGTDGKKWRKNENVILFVAWMSGWMNARNEPYMPERENILFLTTTTSVSVGSWMLLWRRFRVADVVFAGLSWQSW